MEVGQVDFSKVGLMPRMPQVGEMWRLRCRPNEECVCPHCGAGIGAGRGEDSPPVSDFNGQAVTILENVSGLCCDVCLGEFNVAGYFFISLDGTSEDLVTTVPYTWLEPMDDRKDNPHVV